MIFIASLAGSRRARHPVQSTLGDVRGPGQLAALKALVEVPLGKDCGEEAVFMSIKFIRLPALCEMLGLSRSSIYNRLGNGKYSDKTFPRPIRLSPTNKGVVAWDLREVEQWMVNKATSSRLQL